MKLWIAGYLKGFACGVLLTWSVMETAWFKKHMSTWYESEPPSTDAGKWCEVVTHSSSDGSGYWSCEKRTRIK